MVPVSDLFEIKTLKQKIGKKIEGVSVSAKRKNLSNLRKSLKGMNFNTVSPEVVFGQRKPTFGEKLKSAMSTGKVAASAGIKFAKGTALSKSTNIGRQLQGRKPIDQLKGGHNMSRAEVGSVSPNKYLYGE